MPVNFAPLEDAVLDTDEGSPQDAAREAEEEVRRWLQDCGYGDEASAARVLARLREEFAPADWAHAMQGIELEELSQMVANAHDASATNSTPDRDAGAQAGPLVGYQIALVEGAGSNAAASQPAAVASAGTSGNTPDLQAAFARIDRSCDGHLSRAEVIRALREDAGVRELLRLPAHVGDAQRTEFEGAFQSMDVNDNREVAI